MSDVTSLCGPVEKFGEVLMLRIPLDAGGDKLADCSKGISEIQDGFLCIEIKDWLAQKLSIIEGSFVTVDNADGKFNIRLETEE
ncbi:MAG: hypothetical protein SFU85_00005 [Candidatus Methylacidiphilales bacterium]|nr:hypothetical protein [Candidatus Methylacidiphilales bacterium]